MTLCVSICVFVGRCERVHSTVTATKNWNSEKFFCKATAAVSVGRQAGRRIYGERERRKEREN